MASSKKTAFRFLLSNLAILVVLSTCSAPEAPDATVLNRYERALVAFSHCRYDEALEHLREGAFGLTGRDLLSTMQDTALMHYARGRHARAADELCSAGHAAERTFGTTSDEFRDSVAVVRHFLRANEELIVQSAIATSVGGTFVDTALVDENRTWFGMNGRVAPNSFERAAINALSGVVDDPTICPERLLGSKDRWVARSLYATYVLKLATVQRFLAGTVPVLYPQWMRLQGCGTDLDGQAVVAMLGEPTKRTPGPTGAHDCWWYEVETKRGLVTAGVVLVTTDLALRLHHVDSRNVVKAGDGRIQVGRRLTAGTLSQILALDMPPEPLVVHEQPIVGGVSCTVGLGESDENLKEPSGPAFVTVSNVSDVTRRMLDNDAYYDYYFEAYDGGGMLLGFFMPRVGGNRAIPRFADVQPGTTLRKSIGLTGCGRVDFFGEKKLEATYVRVVHHLDMARPVPSNVIELRDGVPVAIRPPLRRQPPKR